MTGEKQMPTVDESALALSDTCNVLTDLTIPFMLDGGTLLGFHRDGIFAEDDHDDIDLTVLSDSWPKHKQITEAMLARGFVVYKEWPRNPTEKTSGQLAFKRGEVKVDIMFKEKKGEKLWWTVFGGPRGVTYKAVPAELIDDLLFIRYEIPLADGSKAEIAAGFPKRVVEYLTYRYGDWQTPVHRRDYSCYTTDRCIVEENTYDAI